MEIILGSQSPRRVEVLRYFHVPFTQVTSHFDESTIPFKGKPDQYVITLAEEKARSLQTQFPDACLITADTIVYASGKVLGKPKDLEEAFHMLKELNGKWHEVYTGLTVSRGASLLSEYEVSRVLFNDLTDSQIRTYITHVSPLDKAGSYHVLGTGGMIVNRFEGCFYNIMGMPTNTLRKLLKAVGIDLWDYLD